VIYIKMGVTQTIPNQHPARGSRGWVVAVTCDDEDPAYLDVVTIETAGEGYWSFRSLTGYGTGYQKAATQWFEGVRSLFTPDELVLLADSAALPAPDYDAINATRTG
jgi:hypothetical protein